MAYEWNIRITKNITSTSDVFTILEITNPDCFSQVEIECCKQQQTCHQTSSKFVDLGFVKISDELVNM